MLIMNIVMAVVMYPILLMMYFMLRGAGDENRPYCFGATLSGKLRKEEPVQKVIVEYKKTLKKGCLILAVIPIICFLIPYISIAMTIWFAWILAVCFVPMVPFAIANKKIQELKIQMGWEEAYEVSYTDLKSVTISKKVKLTEFLPPILISIVPVIISIVLFGDEDLWIFIVLVAVFAVCTLLFYLCAIWCDRQKISVISYDSDTNMNYARAKKQVWKNLWLACAWINTTFTWCMLFFTWQRSWGAWGIVIASVVYAIAVMAVCMMEIKRLWQIDVAYADKKTIIDAVEDDRNWILGMFYYNKKDKHYMVESRMGTGTTVNLANKAGFATSLFGVLALLCIPLACIWMILVEMTPISMTVENDKIICEQLSTEYEIPFSDITDYEVVEDLPEMTKMSGIGMDNLYQGTFEVYRQGTFETFLNPQNELFLWVETEDEVYYLSGATDEQTRGVIELVEEYME